jgi:hypothetical protein
MHLPPAPASAGPSIARPRPVLAWSAEAERSSVDDWLCRHDLQYTALARGADRLSVCQASDTLVFTPRRPCGVALSLSRSADGWQLGAAALARAFPTRDAAAGMFAALLFGAARVYTESLGDRLTHVALELQSPPGTWTRVLADPIGHRDPRRPATIAVYRNHG